jgi:hypothetical protein
MPMLEERVADAVAKMLQDYNDHRGFDVLLLENADANDSAADRSPTLYSFLPTIYPVTLPTVGPC